MPLVNIECKKCEKQFEIPDWRNAKFCSTNCSKGRVNSGCFVKGQSYEDRYGIKKAKEMRELVSKRAKRTMHLRPTWTMKGRKFTEEHKRKIGEANSIALKGHKQSVETIKKRLRKNPISSLEKKMIRIINKNNLPYKFVGNGDFILGNKCPDFINYNGKKIAIEVFYRDHKEKFNHGLKEWKKKRTKVFNEYGWKLFFFDETQVNEEYILNKGGI